MNYTDFTWINANEIRDSKGDFFINSEPKILFGVGGKDTKEKYIELIDYLPTLRELADKGIPLEEIQKMNTKLGLLVKLFFIIEGQILYVSKKDGYYLGGNTGRHRLLVAQELNVELPVIIRKPN